MPETPDRIVWDVTGCLAERVGEAGVPRSRLELQVAASDDLRLEVAKEREGGRHRYLDLERSLADAKEAVAFAGEARPRFRRFVQCGIGGSALGNIAFHEALDGDREVTVLDNVDPMRLRGLEGEALRDTLVHVVTKSGETAETAAQFLVMVARLRAALGTSWREHLVVTTDGSKGTMRSVCDAEGLRTFRVPDGVGGRFSCLSPVGLLSLAFAGRDPVALVEGAMRGRARSLEASGGPALAYACLLHRFFETGRRTAVFWPYSDRLGGVARWWAQLLAESIGKRKDLAGRDVSTGPLPVAARGATDQHSVHQLFMEGPADKWFTLVEVASHEDDVEIPSLFAEHAAFGYLGGKTLGTLLNAERRGTTHALVQAGRPTAVITIPRVDEAAIGELLSTLMLTITFAGRLFHVDPYDQPGVEAGKLATFALMGRAGQGDPAAIEQALRPLLVY